MEWQEKETIIINFIDTSFQQIISENPTLPIRLGLFLGLVRK